MPAPIDGEPTNAVDIDGGTPSSDPAPQHYLTASDLQAFAAGVSAEFTKALNELDAAHTKKLNDFGMEVQNALKNIVEQVNTQLGQSDKKGGVVEQAIQEIIPLLKEQLAPQPAPPTGLDATTLLLKKAIDREAQKVVLGMVKGAVKKGLLFEQEVESVVTDKVVEASHEPF